MRLKGKTTLVTGGATGLGFAVAGELLRKGMKVAICGRTKEALEAARRRLKSANLLTFVCDITNYQAAQKMVGEIGRIDALINNAGIYLEGDLEKNSVEQIAQTLDTNLKGTIFVTKAVLPKMKRTNHGYIINVSSTSGVRAKPSQSVYVASKFGVQGFTDSLKLDLAATNVKVVGLYLGGMRTQFFAKAGTPKPNELWMDPKEIAGIIAFILERDDSLVMDHVVVSRSA